MAKRLNKPTEDQEFAQEEREIRREYFVFIPVLLAIVALISFSLFKSNNQVLVELVKAPGENNYWLVYDGGEVKNFGTAAPVEDIKVADGSKIISAQKAENGFWAMSDKGVIYPVLGAQYAGGVDSVYSLIDVAELFNLPNGKAYRIASKDGKIYDFNTQPLTGGATNNKIVAAAASTTSGEGYWLIEPNGNITTFGDAELFASKELDSSVVVDASPYGSGFIVLTNSGEVFVYGSGAKKGDLSKTDLKSPVIDIDADSDGDGYTITAQDGTITNF